MEVLFLHFKNMKLKTKLFCIYIFAFFVTLILLMFVLHATLGKQLFSNSRSSLQNSIDQSISQLENHIENTINLSNVIYNNDSINSACNIDYGDDYFKMYTSYSNVIKPELSIYKCLIPEVTNIRIYSSCGILPNKNLVEDISSLEEKSWFSDVKDKHNPQWIMTSEVNGTGLASVRKLPKIASYPFDNYLYLEINYEDFFSCMNNINQEEYALAIVDSNNNILYQYDSFPDKNLPINVSMLVNSYEKIVKEYEMPLKAYKGWKYSIWKAMISPSESVLYGMIIVGLITFGIFARG